MLILIIFVTLDGGIINHGHHRNHNIDSFFANASLWLVRLKFLFAHEDSSVVVLRVDPEASKKSDSSKSSDLNRSRSYSVKTESRTANTVGGMGSWNKGQILGQTLTSKRFKVKSYIHILIGPKSSYWA